MTTPNNLPALIKEMQERARDKAERGYLARTYKAVGKQGSFIPVEELDTHTADTANAILEYVKGVAGGMKRDQNKKKEGDPHFTGCGGCGEDYPAICGCREVNQALDDLIARLTSNPQ